MSHRALKSNLGVRLLGMQGLNAGKGIEVPLTKLKAVAQFLTARRSRFVGQHFSQATYDRFMAMPEPEHTYGIFFTPRSGSTRITQLILDAQVSNAPREFFNETSISKIAGHHSARSLAEYVALIRRKQQVGGHFGFEVTYKQILLAFFTSKRFMQLMQPDHSAWLIREDIVAQAVSVSRLKQTGVSHAPRATAEGHLQAEQAFQYRPNEIRTALKSLDWYETRSEKMFARHGLQPFRFSYEVTNALGPEQTVAVLAKVLHLPEPVVVVPDVHHKLSGEKASEFAVRFTQEHPDLITSIQKRRAPLLDKVYQHAERNL